MTSLLYAQKRAPKNIHELSEIIFSDSAKAYYSQEEVKNYYRAYWHLSTRFDSLGTIDGYKKAVKNYYVTRCAIKKPTYILNGSTVFRSYN